MATVCRYESAVYTKIVTGSSKFLPNFHKRCPDFEIEMVQATSFNIDELVRNGYLDLALLVQDPESVGLEFETCTTEELVFIVAKKNPLVKELALEGKSRIEPGELFRFKDEGLIVSKKGYRLRTVVERYLRKIGLSLRVAVETTENDLTCNLVASGEGVGFVPIAYMGSHSDLIGFSLNPEVTWEYGVEYREGLQITPCMRRFIDDFKAYASVDSNW